MEFSIRDFAPIKEANIKLDGLTVIAGDNDTGKSTVGKLLYCLVEATVVCVTLDSELETEKDSEDVITTAFSNIYHSVLERDAWDGKCTLFSGSNKSFVDFVGFGGFELNPDLFEDVLFIETPMVWQFFNTFQGIASTSVKKQSTGIDFNVSVPPTYFSVYAALNGSVPASAKTNFDFLKRIEKTVNGKVTFESNTPVFARGNELFSIKSAATGIQSFALIQRIIELGRAAPGQLLILDEPEVHLHPKWQLEYARLLVDMVDQLGLTVLLTTHSAVFVEAIEMIGRSKLGDKCSIYLSERDDSDDVIMKDVTDDLDQIYFSLGQPLVRLSMLQEDA